MLYLAKKRVVVYIGIFGFLWFPAAVCAEQAVLEVGPAIPSQEPFTLGKVPSEVTLEETVLERPSFDQEIPFENFFQLRGAEVASGMLQSRFTLGRRIESQILKPEKTFRISSRGGLRDYLDRQPQKNERALLDPEAFFEQQLTWGFDAAEATVEFLNSTAVPMVGGLLSGVLEVGQDLRRVDKRLRKHRLHLRYSNGGPTASYRVKY